jgi:mRNA interferase RelE/StbE
MASYKIGWKHSAEKDLRKIDKQHLLRILNAVALLANDPFPANHRKLAGSDSSYRLRVGDYRVIYQVDHGDRTVTIFYVRHRRDAYRNLSR